MSCELQLRFNEWGRAVADLQIKHLEGTLSGQASPDWHFMAFGHPDDLDVGPLRRHVASVLMKVGAHVSECHAYLTLAFALSVSSGLLG